MATSHLYALNGGTSWSVAGVQTRNLWVWDGSSWRPVIKQWIWDGTATWRLGYDSTPGPLASIVVSPSSATVSQGGVQTFTAIGMDSDGRSFAISPTWSISTITDSIDASGNFTAGFSSDSGTVTATVGTISGTATYTVP